MKKKFDVVIRAVITKTIAVEASNSEDASELANELFNVGCDDGVNEDYKQETLSVDVVK